MVTLAAFFNAHVYLPTPLAQQNDQVPKALLAANRSALELGAPSQMQQLFPEGYYFCYLFHGLTWVELAMRDGSYTERAIDEAVWCLSKLDSLEGRRPFPPGLPPDHGMFYSAWKCSLRAGIVLLQEGNDQSQAREYAYVARPWFSKREHCPDKDFRVARHWRWQIHALSTIVFLPALFIYLVRRSRRKKRVLHD